MKLTCDSEIGEHVMLQQSYKKAHYILNEAAVPVRELPDIRTQ